MRLIKLTGDDSKAECRRHHPKGMRGLCERMERFQAVYEDEVSSVFNFGNMSVNLLDISESHELMKPGIVATRESGFRFLLTIWVDDVDEACEELKKRGVALLNGPIDRPWGVRTASFVDPAGHAWEIAKQICC